MLFRDRSYILNDVRSLNKPTWIMDKKTVFIKTTKGEQDGSNLSSDLKRILSLIDNKSRADELAKRAPPSLRAGWMDFLGELVEAGYIRDKNATSAGPKIAVPKSSLLKMFSHKPAEEPELEELDYNSGYVAPAPSTAALEAQQKADEAARIRAEMEAAVAAAKIRASAEALAKAEAKARQQAENEAHAKALAQAEAASKAEYHAKKEAESAARAIAAAEAKAKQEATLRAQAEAKAKANQEAALRLQEQQEAARAKAKLEEAIRVRAEIEAAARAQQVAEAKAKQEMAARIKAEQEAAQAKAALEAAAKAKIEEAVRVRAEIEAAALAQRLAEENARREAEAVRLKAEQEIARVKAELEAAAKAKAEEEARVRAEIEAAALAQRQAEENARREAEAARLKAEENARREAEAARLRAEQEALRVKAELEAAKARAEAEAKVLAEALARQVAEEKARQEAEAARLKAEQAAAQLRAEQEVEARIRAEADIKAAEALARQHAAEAAVRREADELAIRAAELAALNRIAQESPPLASAPRSFEINLDGFLNEDAQDAAPAGHYVKKVAEDGARAKAKAEEVRSPAAEAKPTDEINSMHGVAAEMARLKSEAEAARRKLEEDARRHAEEKALAEEQSRAWEEAEQRAKVQAILEIEQSAQQSAMSQAKATPKPVVRKHRKPLPLGKITFTLIILAVIAVLVLPYVYPLQEYIAPLEQQLSARLKQPVHIGGMSATSLPPRLKLRNVTVGSAQEVKAGTINLNFDLLSLFSGVKAISNAEIEDVSIQGNQLDKLAVKFKMLGSDAQYPVRHLTLKSVKIVTDEIAMPVMNGIADMDAQGAFSRITLHSTDDKLSFDLQPNQGRWQLSVNLKASSLPIVPDVVFDDLSAKGDLGDGEVNFTEMDAHIYSGILLGKAKLSWSKGWQLQGSLEAKLFDLDKFFPKYHIEGEMYGEGNFSMTGAKLSQMDDAPHLDGSFSVKKGLINIDMAETARLMSRENLVGGRTRYDDLIGLVVLDNHVLHLRQLRIASGALSASGAFDVLPSNQISGNFNAEIKLRDGNNPLTLFGTLAEPKLRAGR